MSATLAPTSTAARESNAAGATTEAQWTDVTPLGDNEWLRVSLDQVQRLRGLGTDWDGYGSRPPNRFLLGMADTFLRSLWRMSGFLPAPSIVPVPGGALQFEWVNSERELEVVLELEDHNSAAIQVRFLQTVGGAPAAGGELEEPKELVPLLLWLIEG